MPLILVVSVVGMSQITSTQILQLTKPNYNASRISPLRYEVSHKPLQIELYGTRQFNHNTTETPLLTSSIQDPSRS